MRAQLQKAKDIIPQPIDDYAVFASQRREEAPRNPPMITIASGRVSRCQGCKKDITSQDKAFPRNMLLRIQGMKEFKRGTEWIQIAGVLYFHLSIDCFRKKYPAVKWFEFHCKEEDFLSFKPANLRVLMQTEFLPYIVANFM
jgi:hypothetical protein